LSSNDYTDADSTKLANLSGVNISGKVDKETGKGLSSNDYTDADSTKLANLSGVNTGDQDLSGKVDKVAGKDLSTNDYSNTDAAKVANLSGINSGDQDIAAMNHTNRTALDAVTGVNTGDQDLSGKVDKVAGMGLSSNDYSNTDSAKVANLSGVNTGDQDLSGKVDKVAGMGLSSNDYSDTDSAKVANLSGVNTGDQDLSGKVDKVFGKDLSTNDYTNADYAKVFNLSGVNTGDQDLSGKVDVVTGKGLSTNDYTDTDAALVANLSGINTGDQDLSGKVDAIAGKGLSSVDYSVTDAIKVSNLSGINTGDQNIDSMYHSNRAALNVVSGTNTGDQDLTVKVDKIAGKDLSTNDYTNADKVKVSNLSGINTGDQNIDSMYHSNRAALNVVSGTNTGDQDLSGKVDKVDGKILTTVDYSIADAVKVANLSGTNTGDQNIDSMYHSNRAALNVVSGTNTGDQDLTVKVDKIAGKGLSTNDYTNVDKVKVSNLSGINTGDQDITAMTHANRIALDSVAGVNTGDQDLSGKVDKISGKGLSTNDYTVADATKVSNLSGINTGDQNLSGLTHTNRAALDLVSGVNSGDQDLTLKVDKIAGKGLSSNDYTDADSINVSNLSGVNTGDQDLAGLTHTNRVDLDMVSGINTGDQDLSGKVDKVAGKGLSTSDFTQSDSTKLAGIAAGAEVNVNPDWNASSGDAQILNKPDVAGAIASIVNKQDKIAGKSLSTNDYTSADKLKVANLSGTNTGDQDLTDMFHVNRADLDLVSGVNTGDQDLSGKVDKVAGKGLSTSDYTQADSAKVSNLSGVNTGDQDLSGKVDKVAGKDLSANDYTNTDAAKVANLSGINSGDNAVNSLYSGLVSNATHSGDVTGSGALTLATVNANLGTYNNITINAKGLATAGSNVAYLTAETDPSVKAINGIVKSNGTTISAATAGADYLTPTGSAAALTSFPTFNQNTTGSAGSFTGSLTGEVTGTQGATVVGNAAVIAKVLTGYTSGAGTISATDNILQAIQKLNGNDATNANLTGMVTSVGNATTVVTNANLTGEVTSVGNTATVTNAAVIAKVLTGYTSGAGTIAATDNILQAIQKLNGNDATNANLTGMVTSVGNAATVVTNANLTGPITSTGNATSIASQTGTGTTFVMDTSPTLVTPNLGTPSALIGTNITGTASGLTAGNVTTNANLTGDVTSTGNASTIANNVVSNAKLSTVATATIKGRVTAGTGIVEDLTAAQVRTILNVADGATNYTHPTGDGNLHVPATSTTNSGKVLTAGATAGSLTWETPATGTVTAVTGTAPIVSSGGATPAISISAATTVAAGSMSAADKTKLDGLMTSSHYLGEAFDGGIIFNLYKGSDGLEHGLIVALTESVGEWQNPASLVNASRSWDGAYNSSWMTSSPAMAYVTGLGAGWYLPSIDELSILWHNRFYVNNALNSGGNTLLSNAVYWSSTEFDATTAFQFYFSNGYAPNANKTVAWSVRAVRSF
jgi:hypothetical protein